MWKSLKNSKKKLNEFQMREPDMQQGKLISVFKDSLGYVMLVEHKKGKINVQSIQNDKPRPLKKQKSDNSGARVRSSSFRWYPPKQGINLCDCWSCRKHQENQKCCAKHFRKNPIPTTALSGQSAAAAAAANMQLLLCLLQPWGESRSKMEEVKPRTIYFQVTRMDQ